MRRLPLIAALLAWPALPMPVGPVPTDDAAHPPDGTENAPHDGLAQTESPAFGNETALPAAASSNMIPPRAEHPTEASALASRAGAPPRIESPAPEAPAHLVEPEAAGPAHTLVIEPGSANFAAPGAGARSQPAAMPWRLTLLDYAPPDYAATPIAPGLAAAPVDSLAPVPAYDTGGLDAEPPAALAPSAPAPLQAYDTGGFDAEPLAALAPPAPAPLPAYDTGGLDAEPPAALAPPAPAPALAHGAVGLSGKSAVAGSGVPGPEAGPSPPTIAYRETGSEKSVFDGDFLLVAAGVIALPSYEGSNDTSVIPAAAIAGSIAGIGINPRAGGLALDLVPDAPGAKLGLSLGPVARIRANRTGNVRDPAVARLGKLDTVVEAGVSAGLTIRRALNPHDRLTLGVDARWDVSGHGSGYVISPSASYLTPLSRAMVTGLLVSAEFADRRYAHYNYDVTAAGAVASGLPAYSAKGGLKAVNFGFLIARDLNANLLDGGLSIGVGGMYQRLYGSAAASPIATIRGSANQWIVGGGLGYVF